MTERVTMRWPDGLKDRVRSVVGERGITQFAVTAVENALSDLSTGPVNEPEESGPISGPVVEEMAEIVAEADSREARVVPELERLKDTYGLVTGRSLQAPTKLCPDCSTPLLAGAECAACSF